MKIRSVVIDDERPGRDNMVAILSEYFSNIENIGQADSVDSGIKLINNLNPDLVFLDVELGLNSGFEIIENLPSNNYEVIFVTAYQDYAAKAFRTHAIDYILKPIDIDELSDAIKKVELRIMSKHVDFEKIDSDIDISHSKIQLLKISTTEGIEMIKYDDIIYFNSANYYSIIKINDEREIISSKHLKDYEDILKNTNFYRIHNSFIINTRYLKNITSDDGFYANLTNGKSIKISRRRKDDFIKYLDNK